MSREPYTAGEGYFLYPMSDIDKDKYVELQLQLNGENSLFYNPISREKLWNDMINEENNKYYSIYDDNGDYCGCIELQNCKSETPEIGLNLVENKRNQGIAAKVVKQLVQKVCKEQDIDYFLIKIKSDNSHSKYVFEKMGAIPIGEENYNYTIFMKALNNFMDEDSLKKIYDTAKTYMDDDDENKFVYRYKLSPEAFL